MLTHTESTHAGDYAATIITVKAARDDARAGSIRDLVDVHRRLQGSVLHFLSSFGDARKPAVSTDALSLDALASRLEMRAHAAKFPRMAELSETLDGVCAAAHERKCVDYTRGVSPKCRNTLSQSSRCHVFAMRPSGNS